MFRKVKEINSLDQDIKKLRILIEKELNRITKLEESKHLREKEQTLQIEELKNQKSLLQNTENRIAENQSKLTKSKINLSSLIDEKEINALNSQISNLIDELDSLEDSGLNLIESIEKLEISIDEANTFKEGISETIYEIKLEVETQNQAVIDQINSKEARLEILLQELPDNFMKSYRRLLEKNLKFGALTKIVKNECYICKYVLAAAEIVLIEDKFNFKSCGACSRIFVPNSTSF